MELLRVPLLALIMEYFCVENVHHCTPPWGAKLVMFIQLIYTLPHIRSFLFSMEETNRLTILWLNINSQEDFRLNIGTPHTQVSTIVNSLSPQLADQKI